MRILTAARAQTSQTQQDNMIHNIALTFALMVASHMCGATPVPDPNFGHHHRTHIKIHVPHEVHTVHHHHVEKIPIIKEIPIIKTIPIVKTVHVPIVKHVAIETPVFVHSHEHYGFGHWH